MQQYHTPVIFSLIARNVRKRMGRTTHPKQVFFIALNSLNIARNGALVG